MPLTDLETAWLKYAYDVVACDSAHLEEFNRLRKPWFEDCGLDDSIRWPCNLGSRYESAPVRILCLAQIHNDKHLSASIGDFQLVLRAFRDGSMKPADFLVRCRESYEKTITQWGTWPRFYEIAPVPVEHVAYANVAKCWAPADQSKKGRPVNNQPAMKACNKRFSVQELVSILSPDLIVQIGACDAIKSTELGAKRFVVNNTHRPDAIEQRKTAAEEVRRLFGSRLG